MVTIKLNRSAYLETSPKVESCTKKQTKQTYDIVQTIMKKYFLCNSKGYGVKITLGRTSLYHYLKNS